MYNVKEDFKKFANSQGIATTTMDDFEKYQISNNTPYILEERQMNVTQMDVFSRMMLDRIIFVTGGVDQRMSDVVQAQLLFLESLDRDKDITFYLNSPGGSVNAGLGMVDTMNFVNPDIATVNIGMCASMGSILLGAGTVGKRSSLGFSKVMIHQVSSGASGTVMDNRISHMEAEKYNYILFKLLSQYSGKKFDDVLEMANRDKWLNSQEALDFGIIDEVLQPKGQPSITDYMKGFDSYYKKIVSNLK